MVVRPIFSLVADWVALWLVKIAGEQKGGVRESRWARIRTGRRSKKLDFEAKGD